MTFLSNLPQHFLTQGYDDTDEENRASQTAQEFAEKLANPDNNLKQLATSALTCREQNQQRKLFVKYIQQALMSTASAQGVVKRPEELYNQLNGIEQKLGGKLGTWYKHLIATVLPEHTQCTLTPERQEAWLAWAKTLAAVVATINTDGKHTKEAVKYIVSWPLALSVPTLSNSRFTPFSTAYSSLSSFPLLLRNPQPWAERGHQKVNRNQGLGVTTNMYVADLSVGTLVNQT